MNASAERLEECSSILRAHGYGGPFFLDLAALSDPESADIFPSIDAFVRASADADSADDFKRACALLASCAEDRRAALQADQADGAHDQSNRLRLLDAYGGGDDGPVDL